MKGDVIIVEQRHRRASAIIAQRLAAEVRSRPRRTTISVAGESGSGKSEMGQALVEAFDTLGIPGAVLGQDDYFVLPPRSNDRARRQDLSEVRKPLVVYADDSIEEETISLAGARVVVAEGTYTTLLQNVDTRVFIARNRLEPGECRVYQSDAQS